MTDLPTRGSIVPAQPQAPLAGWERQPFSITAPPRPPFERIISALRRYKWFALGTLALAVLIGFMASRLVKPQYEVRATIWIEPEAPLNDRRGPIRSNELLSSAAWIELLRSYRIVDAVVQKLALYVQPSDARDLWLFSSFAIAGRFLPGAYELEIDRKGKRWKLEHANGMMSDSGAIEDSVGRKAGIRWVLPGKAFVGSGKDEVDFTLSTPRETAVALMKRMTPELPQNSNFLWLRLRGEDPELARLTLNTWITEFVAVASELKRRNVVEFANILSGQLSYAERSLHNAERALESFRVQTITLPAEGGPVAAGVEVTRDPALKSFFDQKIEYDDLRHDRQALEKVIADARAGSVPWETALLIPSVAKSPGANALREAFNQLHVKQAELAAKREIYTDQHQAVREALASVSTLESQTIPRLAAQLLVQLREREGEYNRRIASASRELQSIPTRTIEEMRLRRAVAVSEALYTGLKSRSAEAQLAAASTTPDVTVLDSAVAPLYPTRNTAPSVLLMAVLGGLAAAIALAMLLDSFDPRIQYPEQVTGELGLSIAGAIPLFPKAGVDTRSPEQVGQLIESIRTVRMHVQNASGVPLSIAVTSPSPGDGKSFVAANLAMSFSDAGFRTVLVDGDTRRGTLHGMFQLPISPGLTEYLSGAGDVATLVHATQHQRLSVLTRGARQRNSPELLTSQALPALASELRRQYDIVVYDTPPLAAGVDAFAVATAANDLLLVLRIGQTDRRMAAAKLELLDRLPVRVLGAVLNGVELKGEFGSYKYADGYGLGDETSTAMIPSRSVE